MPRSASAWTETFPCPCEMLPLMNSKEALERICDLVDGTLHAPDLFGVEEDVEASADDLKWAVRELKKTLLEVWDTAGGALSGP